MLPPQGILVSYSLVTSVLWQSSPHLFYPHLFMASDVFLLSGSSTISYALRTQRLLYALWSLLLLLHPSPPAFIFSYSWPLMFCYSMEAPTYDICSLLREYLYTAESLLFLFTLHPSHHPHRSLSTEEVGPLLGTLHLQHLRPHLFVINNSHVGMCMPPPHCTLTLSWCHSMSSNPGMTHIQ
jgi:hypothetical protein